MTDDDSRWVNFRGETDPATVANAINMHSLYSYCGGGIVTANV